MTASIGGVAQQVIENNMTLRVAEELFRAALIRAALEASGGCVTVASRRLGIHRNLIYYERKKL